MMLLYLLITPRVSTLGRPGLGAPVPLRLGTSKKEMAVTKVVKEDKLYDQTYRGSASRGLQSPFLPVPLRGTPLPPNNSPGLQSWEALRAGRKSSEKNEHSPGPRVETLGYDKACKACPAKTHRSAGLKPCWYRPWEAWLKTLIALHRSPIRVFCCIMVYT